MDEELSDEILVVNEKNKNVANNTTNAVELVELGSSSEEDEKPSCSNFADYTSQPVRVFRPIVPPWCARPNAFFQQRVQEMRRIRKRRNSNEGDITEVSSEGRLLVNVGKPSSDPDVYVMDRLTNVLQPHQIQGVKFMYDNVIGSIEACDTSDGAGCILAHSMGLGKTLQIITFVEIFFRYTKFKRVIIVCPVNTIQNWANEFDKWLPEQNEAGEIVRPFKVFLLNDSVKGGLEGRASFVDAWYQHGGVLLISYDMFKLLTSRLDKKSKRGAKPFDGVLDSLVATGSDEPPKDDKLCIDAGLRQKLKEALVHPGADMIVCDEGHQIKNTKTEKSVTLNAINTKRRIVLTGYPLQNNLWEYYCMVSFVRPGHLGSKRSFREMFERPIKAALAIDASREAIRLCKMRIHVLQTQLAGFVQRRTQHLLKKILPDSKEYVILVRKSPIQQLLYRAFVDETNEDIFDQNSSFNPLKAHTISIKILNHPDMLFLACDERKKRDLKSNKAINGSSWRKSVENAFDSSPLALVDNSSNCSGNIANNIGADMATSWRVRSATNLSTPFSHISAALRNTNGANGHTGRFSAAIKDLNSMNCRVDSSNAHGFFSNPLLSAVEDDENGNCPRPSTSCMTSGANAATINDHLAESTASGVKPRSAKNKKPTLGEALLEDDDKMDNSIKLEWAALPFRHYKTGILENGAKMLLAFAIIEETTRRGEKILFFSSSVNTLNTFESFMINRRFSTPNGVQQWQRNINYCRFDGRTTGVERERLIDRFNSGSELFLFLISTKAGSLGINLVSASRVIIFDASWNPCDDAQAICRIYRYGQRKQTFIYRLIMNNSMEKAIFHRQIAKNTLQQKVVDHQEVDANVSTKELESLFQYDPKLDSKAMHESVDKWKIEDDLLVKVAENNLNLFAEIPFLHESLMLESEGKLSEEEKYEAELLYERELGGGHLNSYEDYSWGSGYRAMLAANGTANQHIPGAASSITGDNYMDTIAPLRLFPPDFAFNHPGAAAFNKAFQRANFAGDDPTMNAPQPPLITNMPDEEYIAEKHKLANPTPFPKTLHVIDPNAALSETSYDDIIEEDFVQTNIPAQTDRPTLSDALNSLLAERSNSTPTNSNSDCRLLLNDYGQTSDASIQNVGGQSPKTISLDRLVEQEPVLYTRPYNIASDGRIVILRDIKLPSIRTEGVMVELKAGEMVVLCRTTNGTYFKTSTGELLDASDTIYAAPQMRSLGVLPSNKNIRRELPHLNGNSSKFKKRKRVEPSEVIELD